MRAMRGTWPIQMMKMKPPIMATVLYVRTRNFRKLSACAPRGAQQRVFSWPRADVLPCRAETCELPAPPANQPH